MDDERPTRRWQFSLRDICLVMAIVALGISWWLDRSRLAIELEKERVTRLHIHAHGSHADEQNWLDQALLQQLSTPLPTGHPAAKSGCVSCHALNSEG